MFEAMVPFTFISLSDRVLQDSFAMTLPVQDFAFIDALITPGILSFACYLVTEIFKVKVSAIYLVR
jgi:hypothetical protein